MSNAFWAFGSTLKLGDGATPEVFTAIAEITALGAPNQSRDAVDVTHHNSPAGFKEFIPGLRDGGEVPIEANWLPTNATHDATTGLLSTFLDDVLHNWQIVLPNNLATVSFTAFLTLFNPDLPLAEQGKLAGTLKVSGKPTVA